MDTTAGRAPRSLLALVLAGALQACGFSGPLAIAAACYALTLIFVLLILRPAEAPAASGAGSSPTRPASPASTAP